MTLTAEQLVARRDRIGSSDMAAVLGVPTFAGRNAWTCWAEKTGILEPEKHTNAAIDAGNMLEPVVLDYAEHALGKLERQVLVIDQESPRLGSLLDGRLVASRRPVEGKTSGVVGPLHGHWGDAGTDQVPDGYTIQATVHLACTGADICHLVALLGARGFVEYEIHAEPRLIRLVRDVADDFFAEFVLTRRDPRDGWADRLEKAHGIKLIGDPCAPTLEVAKRIRRHKGKVIQLENAEPFEKWGKFRDVRLEAEKAEKAALAVCLAELGDADVAQLPGGLEFAYAEQGAADVIDREAMKAAGIYEKYATTNTCRVARLRGRKKG